MIRFRFVLMDCWFASEENFAFITRKGSHFIAVLKDNRLVALREDDRVNKRFVRVDGLGFPEQNVFMAIYAVFKLECLSITARVNPFALRFKLLINASRTAYAELQQWRATA